MRKGFFRALAAGGGSKHDDDGEGGEATDYLEEALALLRDHRELSHLPQPLGLPSYVVDPARFPYYQPPGGWQTPGDPPFVKVTVDETIQAALYLRDDWMRRQMKSHEAEFTSKREFRVWCGTYNLAAKKPEFPVDPFVCAGEKRRNEKACYDIVVVGFQEMVDLNVQNAVSDAATRERSVQWLGLIERALADAARRNNEPEGYSLLAQKSLVGLMVSVFVLKRHRANVSAVQSCSVATGVMGVVGNKGACAVRFDFFDTSMCFVCAHLAAHTDAVDARNTDVKTINAKATFKLDAPLQSQVPEKHHSRIAATTTEALARGELMVKEHDYVVWLGDFNYRMDASNSIEEVFARVNQRDLFWLRQNDQLCTEMRAGRVFAGMEEVAPISFMPTYKFEPGTDNYDRRPEKKLRAPAWTDRIVWKKPSWTQLEDEVRPQCLVYDRIDYMRASDHKPVEAALSVAVRIINDERRNDVYRQVKRKLNGLSANISGNQGMELSVEPKVLDFGKVYYRRATESLVLTVKNTSAFPLCWRLVPRPGLNDLCASWLTLDLTHGLLLPRESASIRVDCLINLDVARAAVSGDCPLDLKDTLDLRYHPSSEQFATLNSVLVNVQCSIVATCFGASLPSLLWALKPVRTHGTGDEQYAVLQASGSKLPPLGVPKELWRLVNRAKKGLAEHRVFLHHAESSECAKVRDCLDEGTPFPKDISPYAVASVLLEFLDALAEPVVPADYFPDAESLNDPLWVSNFFQRLPAPNANCLLLVVALVQRALVLGQQNSVTIEAVAPLFGEVLFRPSLAYEASKESSQANSTAVNEFASWLTASFTGSGKNDSRAASNIATQAFKLLLTR